MAVRGPHRRKDAAHLLGVLGTLAIVVVAAIAYVAYTANSGLPWQSRYEVTVEVTNANRLIDDADVRIGGVRSGQVLDAYAVPGRRGRRPHARLELALEPSAAPLPVDTRAKVRPASVLGLTYLDLQLGDSDETIPEGGTLPLDNADRTVELTDLLEIFDRSTARSFQETIYGLAAGSAGRGAGLGATIHSLKRLLGPLTVVTRVLADSRTRLGDFVRGYEATFAALGPVSGELAGMVSGGATTFGALARERAALGQAIEAAPATESAVTAAFEALRPALDGLAELTEDLRPAGRVLPATLVDVNTTLSAGVRPLRQLPAFSRRLGTALSTLDRVSRARITTPALRKLPPLLRAIDQTVEVNARAQVHCNAIGIWGQNFSDVFSALGVGQGPALINIGFTEAGAQGETAQNREPSPDVAINFYPNQNERECESGNEPYDGTQRLSNPPGEQSRETRDTDPPPGVRERARAAGLLDDPEGAP